MFVIQKYKVPLENFLKDEDPIIPKEDIHNIFGNIEELKSLTVNMVTQLTR